MYSTCIFCHTQLGSNESVEHFPLGRRLAFDSTRGRLWVVCRKCERWNLTPLEERWEAIEECERLFAATRLRMSTDNIGLARLPEGLELVRIGTPQRPEMAAWRYGDQLGRRRWKYLAYTGVGVAATGLVIAGPLTGIMVGGSFAALNLANSARSLYQTRRVRTRVVLPGQGAPGGLRRQHVNRASIERTGGGWGLHVPFDIPYERAIPLPNGRLVRLPRWGRFEDEAFLRGEAALQVASKLLPHINASGATKREVTSALGLIDDVSEPSGMFARYAWQPVKGRRRWSSSNALSGHALSGLPKEVRLALEMASHEEAERRALEGELALLEEEWRQAEEIAAIADDLFVPDETKSRLAALRGSAGEISDGGGDAK